MKRSDVPHNLSEALAELPGIGPRQAKRIAVHLLRNPHEADRITSFLTEIRNKTATCSRCRRLFINDTTQSLCSLCKDNRRDHHLIMVVAHDTDLEAIEQTGQYRGLYFVIGDTVPLTADDPHRHTSLKLWAQFLEQSFKDISSIIIAMSTTTEGSFTEHALLELTRKVLTEQGVTDAIKVNTLKKGISRGTELEYIDKETLAQAL